MIWKTTLGKEQWSGPQRVVLHPDQSTVWTTVAGRLFRSAPENVRPIWIEESSQLPPADENAKTEMSRLIRMIPMPATSDDAIPEQLETPQEQALDSSEPQQVPQVHHDSPSTQPDHEPAAPAEMPSRQETPVEVPGISETTEHVVPPPEAEGSNDPQGVDNETIFLISEDTDPPALQASTNDRPMCWRVEFDICCQLNEEATDSEATWLLLATAGKKQRTEV